MSELRSILRLGIANRGEPAMRCLRAVKALRAEEGSRIEAVAFYTAVDRDAPFVRHADLAVPLPPALHPVAAYLDHDALLAALLSAGCDAVWPGWGFVAEDPEFADRVTEAGLVFLGPRGDTMRALGDKIAAKRLAEVAGVPVLPWSGEAVADEEMAAKHADRIGYPLLVKASSGGGGRGIRSVEDRPTLAAALRAAASEARAAFGDDRVFLERKVEGGRHVEVQIAADRRGRVLALGARECSVQRRHQKLLEEAPPPGLTRELLSQLDRCAVELATRVGYEGVGTVEFLVAADDAYFLEMNPRLQVEHGITEEVTGIDLVRLQIQIARGESLPKQAPGCRGVAMEARVCAEDPDAGFLPAPGRVTRFEPVLGPRLRIDTGIAAGTSIPAEFDSLVAKVIAWGETRDEARARLACAVRDLELVIEGGASNRGLLLEVLDSEDFRRGDIDTGWLDRFTANPRVGDTLAAEALVVAAILRYQRRRHAARLNFFADPAGASPERVHASVGQQLELVHDGVSYAVQVQALGAWRYRVQEGGRAVSAMLRVDGTNAARLELAGRTLRVLYDATEAGVRLEVDGRVHRFGWQGAGEMLAGTPAVVVAVHVAAGDRVEAGQALGLLEAMKTEIAFHAPVAGTVREVCVRRGQQVSAGDVLLRLDAGDASTNAADQRVLLWCESDLLTPELAREEIRRVLLGYDADAERAGRLIAFLERPLADDAPAAELDELLELRHELVLFADVEQLFLRTPRASFSGEIEPSNAARLRMYVRRMRAGGAGIAEEFLQLLRTALLHYGITDLTPGDDLERAVLRLFASQRAPALRRRLVLGIVRRLTALAQAGRRPGQDEKVADALDRIGAMRGLVEDPLADATVEAQHALFQEPMIEHEAARAMLELEAWLSASEAAAPLDTVLARVAAAPREVFESVGRWLSHPDPRRRSIALSTHLRRVYDCAPMREHTTRIRAGFDVDRLELADGRLILGSTVAPTALHEGIECLLAAAREQGPAAALELIVPCDDPSAAGRFVQAAAPLLTGQLGAARLTLSFLGEDGQAEHWSFGSDGTRTQPIDGLHGLHPELAARLDLERLAGFELERIDARDGLVVFHGRSREIPADERIFLLAGVRVMAPGADPGDLDVGAFERGFHQATRRLRSILLVRDPARRLQWNRISLFVTPTVRVESGLVERLVRRLEPATHHLGLEKVVVRLLLQETRRAAARPVELVISDPTGSHMGLLARTPHSDALRPVTAYERKVVEARRRRLVYPYEILRMLTAEGGHFEEWDLDPTASVVTPCAVTGRPPGENDSGIVFGVLSTPTPSIPEGLERVLILSDPTRGMGSLAGPECDRIVGAIDLAERLGLPVEWVPVSSGARIALDSGTENLDATARVVRRIVRFTDAGGTIHVIVHGVNVGAQSYFGALATMGMRTRGVLIMTPGASLVLTGRAALEASGSVAAEDELEIGGYERVMGPNGEAQYYARDLAEAFRILARHYELTYVVPGEQAPRRHATSDPTERTILMHPYSAENGGEPFRRVGEIFEAAHNPDRKRPFAMRAVMSAVIDQDGGHLERWRSWVGAETAIVWDARIGGFAVSLLGIESRSLPREGYRPIDGPSAWSGGTLFPLASKKIARALNAASGRRPAVILANLSGFDGSPESMRKLQLEYGAEIARSVVRFEGALLFVVVSRYHGGAYVVFSRSLNPGLRAAALEGSYASVIGGGPAASVVLAREVRARADADPRVVRLRRALGSDANPEQRDAFERALADVRLEQQAQLAAEFDAVHTVERALAVGSLETILPLSELRPWIVSLLEAEQA